MEEAPIGSSLNIHMIPPPAPRQQSIPQIAWVLGALLVVAIMGAISYFFVLRPGNQPDQASSVLPRRNVTPCANSANSRYTGHATRHAPTTANTTTAVQQPAPEAPPATVEAIRTADSRLANIQYVHVAGEGGATDGERERQRSEDFRRWTFRSNLADTLYHPRPSAGGHNVVISMDGYDSFQQSVTIEGGQTSNVVGSLSSPRGEIDIVTTPPGVEVLIDGKSYGPSPVRATLPAGNHTYTVKQPGMEPYESAVHDQERADHHQETVPGRGCATGIVEVRTIPPGATVLADGSPVGGQTPTSFRLSVGSHTLVISLSGYRPIQKQVTVSENDTTPININLASQ